MTFAIRRGLVRRIVLDRDWFTTAAHCIWVSVILQDGRREDWYVRDGALRRFAEVAPAAVDTDSLIAAVLAAINTNNRAKLESWLNTLPA